MESIYNRLVFACTVKAAIEAKCLRVSTRKNGTVFGLFRFSLSFLFACAAIKRVNLAFKTTIIKNAYLTLAVIQFKVEANNSLIFCHYKHIRKILTNVPLQSI